jgi:muramoyltetrapeptide carboxypeptidase
MKFPPPLKKNDKIALVSTARKITKDELLPAINIIESLGFIVVLGDSIDKDDNQFAGDDELRANDLQKQLNNPSIKAIICARGGYGTIRILDELDLYPLQKDPKWICGFSDVTALHSHIHTKVGLPTLHSQMPILFPKDGSHDNGVKTLFAALTEDYTFLNYQFETHPLNRLGSVSGELVGGNLSVIYSTLGSDTQINTEGKILFLEDLDEYLYHIDRMMVALDRAGMLKDLAGLIIGGMTDMRDNETPFGSTAEQTISRIVEKYNYPLCFNVPAGHIPENKTLILGAEYSLVVSENKTELTPFVDKF